MFSAIASAFIIEVDSQLQPDPNSETAALLRILIYKIDNTTFGNDVPTLPQWTGPSHAIVQVQAMLFASLTASLFSAFLAMLSKQWLNRYVSTGVRGTAIENSQNRQKKLNGVSTWYFHYVVESLPLMLQVALLLLGCALTRYLWEVNTTVASVILAITSFGIAFYLFIVVAGAAFESCPYQTPGAFIFRPIISYIRSHILPALHPAVVLSWLSNFTQHSYCRSFLTEWWRGFGRPWYSIIISLASLLFTPIPLMVDIYSFVQRIPQQLVKLGRGVYRRWPTTSRRIHQVLASFGKTAYRWLTDIPQAHSPDQYIITLDIQCISWILQTSLDKLAHLAALRHLATIPELTWFDPTLVIGCFNTFINCVSVNNHKVVTMKGFEDLAAVSARCFLRTFLHLSAIDPTSSTLEDLRGRYNRAFPQDIDVTDLPFHSTITVIHHLLISRPSSTPLLLEDSAPQSIPFSQVVVNAAWAECQQMQYRKVPRRFLHLALDSLSADPPPPVTIVADCLKLIAIDLGCKLSDFTTNGSRYSVQV